jgi:hypothetical protein
MGMANQVPNIIIRPNGPEKIRTKCGVTRDMDLADHIGLHRGQISRVLSGKHAPGNKFIAGIIDRCGLKFAFDHVFEIVPDDRAGT